MDANKILYAKEGRVYVLKFVGAIRYTMGCALDDFLDRLFRQDDFDQIVIDLTETTSIDSTSLGLLAKIANLLRARNGSKITLVSSNEDINQILDSMGFYQIFNVCDKYQNCREALQNLEFSDPTKDKMGKTMLEAHNILSELNDTNRQRFENVVGTLKKANSLVTSH
ncbi:MAG: STAS domain-containing protein [Gammaproteobacteria bacterium]